MPVLEGYSERNVPAARAGGRPPPLTVQRRRHSAVLIARLLLHDGLRLGAPLCVSIGPDCGPWAPSNPEAFAAQAEPRDGV